MINYQLRWSLFYTLANKHKVSVCQIIKVYGESLERKIDTKNLFPTKSIIFAFPKKFRLNKSLSVPFILRTRFNFSIV